MASISMLQLLVPVAILGAAGHALALQPGDRGPSVAALQDRLRSTGYFNRSSTGVYSSITADAVRRFQADRGLAVDGIAGPATMAALRNQGYTGGGTYRPISYRPGGYTGGLRLGSAGSDVSTIQQQLRNQGYDIRVDGIFGTSTDQAVRSFQAANNLAADGIVGPATRSALANGGSGTGYVPPVERPISDNGGYPQDSAVDVRSLQQRLTDLGYYSGPIDGIYGPGTRSAVLRFQSRNGLLADGVPGPDTLRVLNSNSAVANNGGTVKPGKRYVVAIPADTGTTVAKVRQYVSGAYLTSSSLGSYIRAGAYNDFGPADNLSKYLRSKGFDSQVRYL